MMNPAIEELARAYAQDNLSATERIRFEAKLAAGDPDAVKALEIARGNFPKSSVAEEKKRNSSVPFLEIVPQKPPMPTEANTEPEIVEKIEMVRVRAEDPEVRAERIKTLIIRIASGLGILLLIYTFMIQWQLIIARQKLEKALKAAASPVVATVPDSSRIFVFAFELDRLKTALTADQGKLIHVAAEKTGPFKKAFLLVDFSTNRTVAMFRSEPLPAGTSLTLWVENRDFEMNLLGSITKMSEDSVYTGFAGDAFVHGRFLEVHLQNGTAFKNSNRVGRIKLP